MIKISVITSLFNCSKYLHGYFDSVEQIVNMEECEFLLLHNAPKEDELNIIQKRIIDKPWFRHIIIEEREGLYATWNRGVKLSNGEYCAVWNVDDVRYPDSLHQQALVLEKDETIGLVSGFFEGTDVYGTKGIRYYHANRLLDDNYTLCYQKCLIGCFPMWRKVIHDSIGYFDEQFRCVSDYDFQLRVAHSQFRVGYAAYNLGIYLENDPNKISSDEIQTLENNLLYKRYSMYNQLYINKLHLSLSLFSENKILNFGSFLPLAIDKKVRTIDNVLGLLVAIIKMPKYLIKDMYRNYVKNNI